MVWTGFMGLPDIYLVTVLMIMMGLPACDLSSFNKLMASYPCDGFLENAEYEDGKCLHVSNGTATWSEAMESCQAMNAILVESLSSAMFQWMKNTADGLATPLLVGGNDFEATNSFMWQYSNEPIINLDDGTVVWHEVTHGADDHVVAMHPGGGWVARKASKKMHYVCQRHLGNPCEHVLTNGQFFSGYCLQYNGDYKTWQDAHDSCQNSNAHLVEPRTHQQRINVNQVLMAELQTMSWIGASYDSKTRSYQWSTDGQDISDPFLMSSQPQDSQYPLCLHQLASKSYTSMMEYADCYDQSPFVCQKDVGIRHRRYVIPHLNNQEVSGDATASVQLLSHYVDTPVYISVVTHFLEHNFTFKMTSLTYKRPYRFDVPPVVQAGALIDGLLEINTTLPVTVEYHVLRHQDNQAETCLVQPFIAWSWGFTSMTVVTAQESRGENAVYVIPTQPGLTSLEISFANLWGNDVTVNGFPFTKWQSLKISTARYEIVHLASSDGLTGTVITAWRDVVVYVVSGMAGASNEALQVSQLHPAMTSDSFLTVPNVPDNTMYKSLSHQMRGYQGHNKDEEAPDVNMSISGSASRLPPSHWSWTFSGPEQYPQAVHLSDQLALWQTLAGMSDSNMACVMPLVPESCWRSEYAMRIADSLIQYYDLNFFLKSQDIGSKILFNGAKVDVTCNPVQDSRIHHCHLMQMEVQLNVVYHISLTSHGTFGAYFVAHNEKDLTCHALGVKDDWMSITAPQQITVDTVTEAQPEGVPTIPNDSTLVVEPSGDTLTSDLTSASKGMAGLTGDGHAVSVVGSEITTGSGSDITESEKSTESWSSTGSTESGSDTPGSEDSTGSTGSEKSTEIWSSTGSTENGSDIIPGTEPSTVSTESEKSTGSWSSTDSTGIGVSTGSWSSSESTESEGGSGQYGSVNSTGSVTEGHGSGNVSHPYIRPGYAECQVLDIALAKEEVEERARKTKKELLVDAKNTSAYVRRRTSAKDSRPSATSMGFGGIAMLSFVTVVVVLQDVVVVVHCVMSKICGQGKAII